MAAKRKAENSTALTVLSKKSRFNEWLSASEEDSDSSDPEQILPSRSSGHESLSEEEDIITKPTGTSSKLDLEQMSAAGMPQKARSSPSRLSHQGSSSEPNIPKDTEINSFSFSELGVVPTLVASLSALSIRKPTPVQAACIPPLLEGLDCIGNAKTGSGKTVAFAIPILQKLMKDPYGIFALILTPTRRELAFQIAEQFAVLGGPFNVRTSVIVGGMDMIAQAKELENRPHILVATPGRMVDHLRSTSGDWDLSRVKFLVLDEADRLLTPTFASELAMLFNALPSDRQTSLFTATISGNIEAIVNATPKPGKSRPFVHRITGSTETVLTLKQYYLLVPSHVREVYLYYLLSHPPSSVLHLRKAPPEKSSPSRHGKQASSKKKPPKRKTANDSTADDEVIQPPPTIIFCTRPKAAAYLTEFLKALDIHATPLHSRLTQRERLNSLNLFRAYVVPVLVSTDVGARGLDIDDVAMVINWDMPQESEEYTHRVGRTARRGRGGVAVSIVTERDEERVGKVEERIGAQLEEMELPESKVLEPLNRVFTAQRVARMQLQDSDFGKREEVHKTKTLKQRKTGES